MPETPKRKLTDKEINSTLSLYRYIFQSNALLKHHAEFNQSLVINFLSGMDGIPPADMLFLLEDSIDMLTKMRDNLARIKSKLEKED